MIPSRRPSLTLLPSDRLHDSRGKLTRLETSARPPFDVGAVELHRLDSFDEAAAAHAALAARARNVFATPEFLCTWWRWFGNRRALHLYAATNPDGRVVGLLPLYEWRGRPVRIFRFIGHGAGDELGPVAEPDARPAIAVALRRLVESERMRVLLGEQLPRDTLSSEVLGARRLVVEGSPVLRFEQTNWADYLANRSGNLRQEIRRFERRASSHDLRCTSPRTAEEFEAGLDALFALHRARWGRPTNFARREQFHREFARISHDRGWARLWLLNVDDRPVAAWYGFRFANTESYYQMGRDPEWDRTRVGFVLLVHSIREALNDGMTEYFFLRGGEGYKYRFANEDPGLETILVSHGVIGAAALATARASLLVRRLVR